ncbi:MAG TPA: LacI family DNA-binding transcriptional regulator [Verrucomicrobiae bacterium]
MVRLKDIAQAAGVSVMTVSKVLRDAPDISAATKVRIRKLSEDMGYVPDVLARGLRSRSAKLFGLLIASSTNPLYARMVMAIEERAFEMGYEVILGHTLNQPAREEMYIRRFLSRRVDGLFVVPVYRMGQKAPIYEELTKHGTPTVILGHNAPFCQNFVNVETDDVGASYLATHHLLQLGHKRIAFLAGHQSSPSSQERLEGYRRALKEAGIAFDDHLVFAAGSTIEEGRNAALQMLNESCTATAVQAVNDLVAIGAANVFLDQGLKIPQDISVMGFGNVLTSEYFRVPLSTVRQPKFRLGVAAMESMTKLLAGERPETQRLSAEVIQRASTAAPKAG